jgi:prefoldin subunit 5
MTKYSSNNYCELEEALKDAANWTQFIENDYERKMSFEDLQDLCVQRCLEKHEDVINVLQTRIDKLEGQNLELERDKEREVSELESEVSNLEAEIEDCYLPNDTLNDVEKLELLKENWDKYTYDNLKDIITPSKHKDNIIEYLKEDIIYIKNELTEEINDLNDQIESLEDKLMDKQN